MHSVLKFTRYIVLLFCRKKINWFPLWMNGGRLLLAMLLLFARSSAFFGNVRCVTSGRSQRRGDSPKFERPSQRGKQNGGTRRCYARWETASFASCGGFKSCLGATRAGQKWAEKCAHQTTKRGEFGRRVWLKNMSATIKFTRRRELSGRPSIAASEAGMRI